LRWLVAVIVFALGAAACTGTPPSATTPAATPAPSATPSPWAEDLAQLDQFLRTTHVSPFTIHSEAEWTAHLASVSASIETATPNERIALVASLVGLLDTHSGFVDIPGGWHFYGIVPYHFSDGWFVINASDRALIGDRLVSIGGMPIDHVVQRLEALVPHDNPDGLLEKIVWLITCVEYLNGAGVIPDGAKSAFGLERRDGSQLTVEPPTFDEQSFNLIPVGYLEGKAPEAVAGQAERIWTRLDATHKAFLVSVNDYGDTTAATEAMTAAFDAGKANRVVFDMRDLQGGSGDLAILDVLKADKRINRPGGLTVLIGRENESVATDIVEFFDQETNALLVGEPTPARADNFRCDCPELTLAHSGFRVSVPTFWERNGDNRSEIDPDVPMLLSSTDFFAGRDPVLAAALAGSLPRSSP
jgi:hypothetical protein